MAKSHKSELQQLKEDYLKLEELYHEEKECLIRVINACGHVVAAHPEMAKDVGSLKALLRTEETLPLDDIEQTLAVLKSKIFSEEVEGSLQKDDGEALGALKRTLEAACGQMRRMMGSVIEDFYPLDEVLAKKARTSDINCREDILESEFRDAAAAFLVFVKGLKGKIQDDFRYINQTFLDLLENVKNLEEVFAKELAEEETSKKIEYFEMQVNREVSSIVHSFDIYRTIQEVKAVVVEKIENIKRALSRRKEEDLRQAQTLREQTERLQERILQAEKAAREMSQRAKESRALAMKDALTRLYNREAFDLKLANILKAFEESGEPFALIVFDIDKFKEINDTLGRVAGDKVLEKVAQCLRESFRGSDFIARYGGDEFVAVIERLTKEMARQKVLTFKRNLAKRRFISHKQGKIDLNVSSGIAVVMDGDTPASLIERADKAMYAAKRGRG